MDQNNHPTDILRALIVDDEAGARDIMEHLLKRIPGVMVMGKASSTDEALEMLMQCKPDLVFIDIQMPEKNGFVLVDYVRKYFPGIHVIFVTAHAEYAINAMKVSAFDYLLKPVLMTELQESILRLKTELKKQAAQQGLEPAVEKPAKCSKIKFNTRTGYVLVSPAEIIYCEADVNYTTIYFGKDNKEVITVNLGKVEELLVPYSFYRISRSMIINQVYLSKADRQKKQCLLVKDNERITLEMSPSHIRELEKFLDGE